MIFPKTILITKSKEDASKYFSSFEKAGSRIIYFPTIKVAPIEKSEEIEKCYSAISEFDWIVFTSKNAVEVFIDELRKRHSDISKSKIACVGNETARVCNEKNIQVDLIPSDFSAAGLLNEFTKQDLVDKKIFIPCSSLSREELKIGLTEQGANVFAVPVYQVEKNDITTLKKETEQIKKYFPELFIFTSPSSFYNYIDLMSVKHASSYFENTTICAMGKTTEATIEEHELTVNIVPANYSLHGIEEAIKKYFNEINNIA